MTFIIFFAAVMAILFFGLGVICKGLAAAFNSAIETTVFIGKICAITGIGIVAIYLVGVVVHGILTGMLLSVLFTIFLIIVYIGFIWLLAGWLWRIIAIIIEYVITFLMDLTSLILEFAATTCERAYAYFFSVIIKQISKG